MILPQMLGITAGWKWMRWKHSTEDAMKLITSILEWSIPVLRDRQQPLLLVYQYP